MDFAETFLAKNFVQPNNSFKFSVDALLLSAFIAPSCREGRLLDLGTGCGIIAIASLLLNRNLYATGVDFQEELVKAAEENAKSFHVSNRFSCVCSDIAEWGISEESKALQASFSVVAANPPYRIAGTGKMPESPLRRQALFGSEDTLLFFLQAAKFSVDKKGRIFFIFPAKEISRLFAALHSLKLFLRQLLFVHPFKDAEANFILVELGLRNSSGLKVLPPLILYQAKDKQRLYTEEALAFCPQLLANATNQKS